MRHLLGLCLTHSLLLCSLKALAFGFLDIGVAKGSDEVMLVQLSAQRHQQPRTDVNGTASMYDADGCPTTDPTQAYFGTCGRKTAKEMEAADYPCRVSARAEPREGDKMVYFMRHAQPVCCLDCGLDAMGVAQCKGMIANNKLLINGPLSSLERAEVIYTSPATRAMETGLRIFGHLGVPFVIDPKLVEDTGMGHCHRCGEEVLARLGRNHPELEEQWYALFPDENDPKFSRKDAPGRVANFTQQLLQRPERHIVVVAHFRLLSTFELGMNCMQMGTQVVQSALQSDGSWRLVSEDSCQGRRRRWGDWGNYRRKRQEKGA